MPGYGMQAATSTLSGNALGRRSEKELHQVVHASLVLAVSIMSLMALGLFLFPDRMMALFTPGQEVVETGAVLLRMVVVSEPLFAVFIILKAYFRALATPGGPLCAPRCACGWCVCLTFVCVRWLGMGLQGRVGLHDCRQRTALLLADRPVFFRRVERPVSPQLKHEKKPAWQWPCRLFAFSE